jgi:hypothetical protein
MADPIPSEAVFTEDPDLMIEEQDDGSAIVALPEETVEDEAGFYSNLAETLDKFKLNTIASDLLELIEKDKEARKRRDEQQEEGIRRTGLGDDAPGGATFDGASKVVHPVLAEGCVDFSARAMKELFPAKGPVKTRIFGKDDKVKLEKARKKAAYLNWQFTSQIAEYRSEKEIELTQLPLGGSQYLKFWPEGGRIHCEFVPIDKLFLPYGATSFYTSPRVTHEQDLTKHAFDGRVRSGLYLDVENIVDEADPELTASQEASNRIEGKEASGYNEDGIRVVYECTCFYEVEDGVKPYIIHLDSASERVLGIYRNWAETDEYAAKLDWFQEDKFIPWRGAYGIGLLHLIGSLAGSATGALRALLDSAHINNAPTAIKLKGGRASGQNTTIDITAVQEIEAPAGVDDIRKVMMPMPFNPPSAVLMQLLEFLINTAKGVVATAEERIADVSDRMPVGTAMALIEQGSQVFSSIHARLHAGQKKALDIVCRLNREYPDLESMQRFEVSPEDFADNSDIDPVSDPNIFSEAQRYAQLQEIMKIRAAYPDLPWKPVEMARRALELVRCEYADEILPSPPPPITADPVTENFMAVSTQAPLKADPQQDHIAHLRAHVAFLLDPLFGAGPALSGQQLQGILAHCQEHLMQVYLGAAKTAAAVRAAQLGESDESTMTEGAEFALQQLQQALPQLAPMLQQAAQTVQQKMPQPPVDPAVQKTFEAAMAEIERKKQVDQQNAQIETQKLQANQQLAMAQEQSKMQLAEAKNFMDLQIASARDQAQRLADELSAQVELMKNEQDNVQHQHTEIVKNLQDNQTQLQIAMEKGLADVRNSVPQTPDFAPQVEQLNKMLASVEGAKTSDALTAVVEGLRETIGHLSRPKMIVTDEQGRPVGIQ